jgi:benzodiazapine receptor
MSGIGKWAVPAVIVAAVVAAAVVGGMFMRASSPEWYEGLRKPSWQPPGWLFGPAWTILYASMVVAACLVWFRARPGQAAAPLAAFAVQLALNAAWTGVFFYLQRPGWALAEIVAMWVAIVVTIVLFWRVRALAGAILLPYLAWVTFAASLNAALWRMNP